MPDTTVQTRRHGRSTEGPALIHFFKLSILRSASDVQSTLTVSSRLIVAKLFCPGGPRLDQFLR